MRATRQEFRLAGDIHIIPNDDHGSLLQEHFTRSNHPEGDSLALKAFQLTQANDFSWQAERLRQFIQLDGSMRATFVTDCPVTSLEITHIGEDGWFLNAQYQHLLDQAFDNFVLLVIKVDSMDHIQL
jgi:hypothetical protein